MKAAVLVAPGAFEIVERPVPEPAEGEVLVKVSHAGICGSDVHIYRGESEREQLPRILGHEFAGRIVKSNARSGVDFAVGDLVTADINIGCGHCTHCLKGDAVLCPTGRKIGIHQDGAFAEYVVVPAGQVIVLPAGMSPEQGALVEPTGCVARSLGRCKLGKEDSLLVIGAGPMGILHVQMARAMGAGRIVVVEQDSERAQVALSSGADATAPDMGLLSGAAARIMDEGGFDVVVECIGKAAIYELALKVVRPGGCVSCFGLEQRGRLAGFEPFDIVMSEKTLVGSVGAMASDMRAAVRLLESGAIDVSAFTKHVFPLDQIDRAMKAFCVDRIGVKVQLNLSSTS